jgi:MFS family permease
MYQTGSTGTYGFLLFLPIILNSSLGYSQELSFLLSAPPAIFAVVFAYTLSWVADKTHRRGPYMVFASILSLIGLAMIGFLDAPVPRYIGAFLGDAGMYSLIVTGLAWGQNNVKGDAKRSVASAIQIMMAGVGGIYSATVFRQQVLH